MSQTISDKINEILTSAPKFDDPEDINWDGTVAQLEETQKHEDGEESSQPRLLRGSVSLDDDRRYAGKAATRKSLRDSIDSVSEESRSDFEEEGEIEDESESGKKS